MSERPREVSANGEDATPDAASRPTPDLIEPQGETATAEAERPPEPAETAVLGDADESDTASTDDAPRLPQSPAWQAFARGDNATARRLLSGDPDADLARRLAPDRVALMVWIASLVLAVVIAALAL